MTKDSASPTRADADKTSPRRVRAVVVIVLILSIELAAIILAQQSPVVGAAALVLFAVLQMFAAMRLGGRVGQALVGKMLLVASALSLAGAAGAGASVYFRKDVQYFEDPALVQRGGPLGWALNPGASSHLKKIVNGQTIYDHIYHVGADGHRRTLSADKGPVVAFFGDSFTFGDGVADSGTLPQAFADLTQKKFRVMNMGVDGYSPAQVLRALELGLHDESLKPAKALFMLTLDWHAARIACVHESLAGAPRYVSEGGAVRLDGVCPATIPLSTLDRLLVVTQLSKLFSGMRRVSDAEVQTYIDVIVQASKLAQSKYGVPLRVLYLRNAGYLLFNGFSDDTIMEQLRRRGVPTYDLTLPREGRGEFAVPQDGHPSALAHRLHAKALIDKLTRAEPELFSDTSETKR